LPTFDYLKKPLITWRFGRLLGQTTSSRHFEQVGMINRRLRLTHGSPRLQICARRS
jgi:hypothetical protein